MAIKNCICLVFVFNVFSVQSQTSPEISALNRINLNRNDSTYTFFAKKPSKDIKITKGKNYYWYNGTFILSTQGGFDGRILDGKYKVNYPNKNLKEHGQFVNGLKDGEWKFWNPNGELDHVEQWHNGQLRIKAAKPKKEKKRRKKDKDAE